MNDQFIQKINIDWDKIDDSNYLRKIPAIKTLRSLELSNSVTFFVGENGSYQVTEMFINNREQLLKNLL